MWFDVHLVPLGVVFAKPGHVRKAVKDRGELITQVVRYTTRAPITNGSPELMAGPFLAPP